MFPHRLTDSRAFDIARAMLDGFNRHYRLFRETSPQPSALRAADWHGQQRAQRERIEFYDKRVNEAPSGCSASSRPASLPMDVWQQVKLHYIGLLTDHHQPELAETFFNSVTTKILHRSYFHNDFIFVRPAVSTEYIENDEPARADLPRLLPDAETLREDGAHVDNFELRLRVRGPGPRRRRRAGGRSASACGEHAARQLPDPGAVARCSSATRAPTSSARSSTASTRCRSPADPARTAGPSWRSTPCCSARTTC
jgi:hypothetical protein